MNKKSRKLIAGLIASVLSLNVFAISASAADNDIDKLVAGMTTEEKIAQMLMPAFRYYTDAYGNRQSLSEITKDVENILEKYAFGGVVLFRENTPDYDPSDVCYSESKREGRREQDAAYNFR